MTKWIQKARTAVITGAAGGIGLEAARRFANAGMSVVIADIKESELAAAQTMLAELSGDVLAVRCDVSDLANVSELRAQAEARFGPIHCLMNNAGIGGGGAKPWEDPDAFQRMIGTNLTGVVNGCHAFIPSMLAHGEPAAVINTGSKQGITRPPGNYAYNISKAGVLAYTESLAHAFRNEPDCRIDAHLLIPAFVYTPMIASFIEERPAFAATAEETVTFMLERLEHGDFYILCPDNETPRALDERRVQWTADDIIKNRPALSRWHPDFEEEFKALIED